MSFDDLKKMGVVTKRARFFITCRGRYYGEKTFTSEFVRGKLTEADQGTQMSMFDTAKLPLIGAAEKQAGTAMSGAALDTAHGAAGGRRLINAGLSV